MRWIALLLCLEGSMAVHEGGHFILMRHYNVEVQEFSLGIGPVIYKKQLAGFQFSLRLVPIMAYVRPSAAGGKEMEQLGWLPFFAILLAGVSVNLLLASLIFLWLKFKEGSGALLALLKLPVNLLLIFLDLLLEFLTFGLRRPRNKGALVLESGAGSLLFGIAWLNLLLGLANLLPARLLDGGKCFFFLETEILQTVFRLSPAWIVGIVNVTDIFTTVALLWIFFRSLRTQFLISKEN